MKTGPSPVQFSTRTRLRPGGPTAPNLRSPLVMGHSTMRSNGSLPSGVVTITVFFYMVFTSREGAFQCPFTAALLNKVLHIFSV